MNLREALCFAIEHLRTRGFDDPDSREAARLLERKAERLRARSGHKQGVPLSELRLAIASERATWPEDLPQERGAD